MTHNPTTRKVLSPYFLHGGIIAVLLLLVFIANMNGQSMVSTRGPLGGKISSILRTKNGVEYVGTVGTGYIWRRNYRTMQWDKVTYGGGYSVVEGMAQDMYGATMVANGKDVWLTTNDGVSWSKSSGNFGRPGKFHVALDGTIFLEAWYKSNNGGRSFTSISMDMVYPESFVPISAVIRYAAIAPDGRLKYTANGITYINVDTSSYGRPHAVLLEDSVVLSISDRSNVAMLVKSGQVVKALSKPPLRGKPVLDAEGNRVILTSNTTDGVYTSTDAGGNWVRHSPIPAIDTISCVSISGDTLYVGTYYNGLFRKTISAADWSLYSSVIDKSYIKEMRTTETDVIVAANRSRIMRYNYAANKYDSLSAIDTVVNIAINTEGSVMAICSDSTLYTYNGQRWMLTYKGPAKLYDIASDGASLYGAGRASLYKSTDNGASWSVLPGAYRYHRVYYANGRIYAYSRLLEDFSYGTSKGLCSTNGGVYWDEIYAGAEMIQDIGDININSANNTGLLVNYGHAIYHTSDGGASWSKTATDVNNGPFYQTLKYAAVSNSGAQLIASKKKGLFMSRDGFKTYHRIYGGPDQDLYTSLKIIGNIAYIGTQEDGLYTYDINSSTWYQEPPSVKQLNVHPTLSNDGTYYVSGVERHSTVSVHDQIGRIVYSVQAEASSIVLDLSSAAKGMYFVVVSDRVSRRHAVVFKQ